MRGKKMKVIIIAISVGICAFLIFAFMGMLDTTANILKAVLISVGIPIVLGCAAAIVGPLLSKFIKKLES